MAEARLTFTRGRLYADRLRSYRILVDGRPVGRLDPRGRLDVTVPPGFHRIEARVDWCRSRPMDIDLRPGEAVGVEVTNTYGAILALWAITFGMFDYLTLRVTAGTDGEGPR